jgi:alpha-tubulin suppressor-like RCC1 family protein
MSCWLPTRANLPLQFATELLPVVQCSESVIDALTKVLADERSIDILLVRFHEWIDWSVRHQFKSKLEPSRAYQPLQSRECRTRVAALEAGDCRLRRSGSTSEFILAKPSQASGLEKNRCHIGNNIIHSIRDIQKFVDSEVVTHQRITLQFGLIMRLAASVFALFLSTLSPPPAMGQYRTCGTRSTEACVGPENLRFTSISAGPAHTCAVDTQGHAWCWGEGRNGALGNGILAVQRWPQRVQTEERFAEVGVGGTFSCARTGGGVVYCWGAERVVPEWPNESASPVMVKTPVMATALAVGRRHACLLDADQRAHCWGFNVDGETGTGSAGIASAMVAEPKAVVGDHKFQTLSAGAAFTCGISIEGALYCWGSNIDGVLGANSRQQCGDVAAVRCATEPVAIDTTRRWSSVTAGVRHACALSSDRAVYCWGTNDVGQAGTYNAARTVILSPQPVNLGDAVVQALHSGGIHTCAITNARVLTCWGADAWTFSDPRQYASELGPRQPLRGLRVSAVSAGQLHICALESNGRVHCWGDSIMGAFGIR